MERKTATWMEAMLVLGKEIQTLVADADALDTATARHFDRRLQPAAFRLLRWLHTHGESTPSALAEGTAMDRAAASRLLSNLEALGYVLRLPATGDRRSVLVQLTSQGQEKMERALDDRGRGLESRINGWSTEEVLGLADALRKFNQRP